MTEFSRGELPGSPCPLGVAHIVINPGKNMNHTDKYLVVPYREWVKVADGDADQLPTDRQFDDYPSAEQEADRLNREVGS